MAGMPEQMDPRVEQLCGSDFNPAEVCWGLMHDAWGPFFVVGGSPPQIGDTAKPQRLPSSSIMKRCNAVRLG